MSSPLDQPVRVGAVDGNYPYQGVDGVGAFHGLTGPFDPRGAQVFSTIGRLATIARKAALLSQRTPWRLRS